MITECEIKEFLYEIDEPLGVENCVLSDEQINHLSRQIFRNREKLINLIVTEAKDKPCLCGFWGDK